MNKIIGLVLLAVFVCAPGLYAQEATSQVWAAVESSSPRPSNAISLAVTGSRYDVARSTSEAFSSAVGQSEVAKESLTPFPVLMPKTIVYPSKAVRRGWEGQTVVAAEVLPDGSVGRTALAKSSGHAVLDQAAQEGIRSWTFSNELGKDATVPQFVDIPVTFKLQEEK